MNRHQGTPGAAAFAMPFLLTVVVALLFYYVQTHNNIPPPAVDLKQVLETPQYFNNMTITVDGAYYTAPCGRYTKACYLLRTKYQGKEYDAHIITDTALQDIPLGTPMEVTILVKCIQHQFLFIEKSRRI
ncbi:MAG TPA: hypothetical protein PKD70_05345 [Saprospiraceae bacterium]|nr:hypothetical protein [Saprospiraceae bacterium]HMP13283.1 hypothetical protein [Saprospiraceae bacterium]